MRELEHDTSPDSPPPARSRIRWWLLKIGLLILVFIAWKGAYSLYRITRPNLPVVDYKQAERTLIESWLSEDERQSSENAADSLERAGKLFGAIQNKYEYRSESAAPDAPNATFVYLGFHEAYECDGIPSSDSVPSEVLLQALAEVEGSGALECLDAAARTRKSVFARKPDSIMFGNLADGRLPRQCRAMARMSTYRALRRLDVGDLDEALRSLAHTAGMARAFKNQCGMMEHLVGYSITSTALYGIRGYINCPIPARERAHTALLEFVRIIEEPPPLSRTIEGERLALLEVYQSVFTGIPPRNNDLSHFPSANTLKLALLHADAAQAINEYFDAAALFVDAAPDQRAALRDQVVEIGKRAPRGVTVGMLTDSFDRSINARQRVISEQRATALILAIALYRERNGRLPDSLDDLSPSILPSLPKDPFAVDGRFGFRVDGDPADPACAFAVYSVGADGADDGGRPKQFDPDHAFEADSDEGTDIVFYPLAD